MGREEAARGAAAVLVGIEKCAVITLLWWLNHAVATANHLATKDAIRVVRRLRLAVLAVAGLNHAVAASGCQRTVGIATPVAAIVAALVAFLGSVHDPIATVSASLAVLRNFLAVRWSLLLGGRPTRKERRSMHSSRTLVRAWLSMLVVCALVESPSTTRAALAAEAHPVPPGAPSPSAVLSSLSGSGPSGIEGALPDTGHRAQRTLAPYFFVAGGDPKRDRLPLKETSAKVAIAGTIASVVVHQVFANNGGKPIEAVYVFPASTRAAVHAMRMHIGARTIEARIAKR